MAAGAGVTGADAGAPPEGGAEDAYQDAPFGYLSTLPDGTIVAVNRTRQGIARAKTQGKYKGRVPTARRMAGRMRELSALGMRPAEIAVELKVNRATVYRILRDAVGPADAASARPAATSLAARPPAAQEPG